MKKIALVLFLLTVTSYTVKAQEVDYNKVENIFLGDLTLYKKISFQNKEKALKPNFRLINKLKKVGSQPKGKELLIKMIRLNDEIDNFSSRKKEESSKLDREISMLSSQIESLDSKHSKHKRELKRLKSEMKYYESLASKARRNYNKYSSLGNANHYLNDAKKYDGKAKSYERRHNNYLRDSKVNQLAQKVNSLIAKKESAKRNRSLTYSDSKLDALKTKLKSLKKQVEDEFDKNMELFASDQNDLGNKYFYGKGVTKDYIEAIKWYRKAAYLGNKYAYYNLGNIYQNGFGVTKDYSEAIKWYRRAASQNHMAAQYNLGRMYENGFGVTKDYGKAIKWYQKAANQGLMYAQYNLGDLYAFGKGGAKDYKEATKWYFNAAKHGYANAEFRLGMMYEGGKGVEKNMEEAIKWYQKAASQGLQVAKDNLKRVKQDKNKVIEVVEDEADVEETVIEVVEDEADVEETIIEIVEVEEPIEEDKVLLFSFGRTSFKKGVTSQIDNIVTILKKYPQTKIVLTGFTDNKEESAMLLSEKRAKAVKAYMVASGKINESRISVKFKGKQNPRDTNFTEFGRAKNRRVEVFIVN